MIENSLSAEYAGSRQTLHFLRLILKNGVKKPKIRYGSWALGIDILSDAFVAAFCNNQNISFILSTVNVLCSQ